MMKKIALTLCAAFAFAAPLAHAAPAAADPAASAAVRELLTSMKYREMMQASFVQLQKNMPAIMQQAATAAINGNAALSAEQKKEQLAKAAKEIPAASNAFATATFNDPKLMDELIEEIVPLYARHFTVAEINQLTAFYKTPVGQKMISTMPAVMNEAMQISQKVIMPRIQTAVEKLSKAK